METPLETLDRLRPFRALSLLYLCQYSNDGTDTCNEIRDRVRLASWEDLPLLAAARVDTCSATVSHDSCITCMLAPVARMLLENHDPA